MSLTYVQDSNHPWHVCRYGFSVDVMERYDYREGKWGRDEWMTVVEMQEYMKATRNKAYDLIWSGEIDSYRLGRKLLVSRASVDAYIESRSGRK